MKRLPRAAFAAALVLGASILWTSPSAAVTYRLLDHGFGNLGPNYGLRVDALGAVFSAELGTANVLLDWDGGPTATIRGELNLNTAGGNGGVGDTWLVDYVLTGVTASGGGFTASSGSGTLTDPLSTVTHLTGEQKGGSGPVFEFFPDGHRIPGDSTTPVGRGWLLPPSSTDDWLVRAVVIPEPTTTALFALGLVGLGFAGRRRPSSGFVRHADR